MVLPLLLGPEDNEAFFQTALVPASKVGLLVVLFEGLVVSVVPMRIIFRANMAALVVLLHVVDEFLDIEEVLLTERAVWMENCQFVVLIRLSLFKMSLQLIVGVNRQLVYQHISSYHAGLTSFILAKFKFNSRIWKSVYFNKILSSFHPFQQIWTKISC